MSIADILDHHVLLARQTALDPAIVDGSASHASKWHAYSICGHVRHVVHIAQRLNAAQAADSLIVLAAAWHDVGKCIAIQYEADGPKFHGHAEAGASYLEEFRVLPAQVIEAIRHHGSLRSLDVRAASLPAGRVWLWLELCDEFGKWTERHFPPLGVESVRRRRKELLAKLLGFGIEPEWIQFAEQVADEDCTKCL